MNAPEIRERLKLSRRRPTLDEDLMRLDREVARTRYAYEQAVQRRMEAARPLTEANPPETGA